MHGTNNKVYKIEEIMERNRIISKTLPCATFCKCVLSVRNNENYTAACKPILQ